MSGELTPSWRQAEQFLKILDSEAEQFTFQTFSDQESKQGTLARVITGSLDQVWSGLVALNQQGAGVFCTVNETNGKGRKKTDIVRARSIWQEDDNKGAKELPLDPHLITETSPGKYHRYLLTDFNLMNGFGQDQTRVDEWYRVQQRMVVDYGSDPNAKDVSRVLRLPGFYHQKSEPHMVQIIYESGTQPYAWETIKGAIPPVVLVPSSKGTSSSIGDQLDVSEAVSEILSAENYHGSITRLAAHYAALEMNEQDIIKTIQGLMNASEERGTPRWEERYNDISRSVTSAIKKFAPRTRGELMEMIDDTKADDLDRFIEINKKIGGSNLSGIEIGSLHKAIKQKSGIHLTALRGDLRGECQRKEVDQQELASLVVQEIDKENLIFVDDWFYLFNQTGVWQKESDRLIKQSIHRVCEVRSIPYTSHLVDAVCNLIKTETFRRNHQFNQDEGTINVRNGELHYEMLLGKWELRPHNREHYRTTQLAVNYSSEALAPRFKQFLVEIFAGDQDAESKALMVLELIGYTMLTTCRYEKFALLIGSGANGKSVLLGILEALLSRQSICAIQPSRFDNPFNRAHLHGKLANIITEIAEGAEIADAQLKAIVSGELTTAEHKHKPPFDFHPFATCWFGTNHMPHTRDFSDALFRRAVVLTFPHKFEGTRCDPHLKDKLVKELPGILNLALAAIAEVFVRGEFTTCESNEEAKRRWRLEADQVAQFIEDECETRLGEFVTVAHLYRQYQLWAEDAGIKRTLNKNNFSNRVERMGYQRGKGTKGIRGFAGLRHLPRIEDASG